MFRNEREVESIRKRYPVGTRLELINMEDAQAPPAGAQGTVRGVDDIGDILMSWDNGSSLKLIIGEDDFRRMS